MSGDPQAQFTAWVRLLKEDDTDPVVALLALADSLPPAAMVQFHQPAAISTMTWSIDFLQPIETTGWRLLASRQPTGP